MSPPSSDVEMTSAPKVVQLNAIRLDGSQLFAGIDQLTLAECLPQAARFATATGLHLPGCTG